MATLLDAPFRKLAAAGMVPIPNVFGDPGDEEWPLDIYLVKREWLAGLLDFAVRTGHPLAAAFGPFFAAFLTAPPAFDVHRRHRPVQGAGLRRRPAAGAGDSARVSQSPGGAVGTPAGRAGGISFGQISGQRPANHLRQ